MQVTPLSPHRGSDELLDWLCRAEYAALLGALRATTFPLRARGKIQSNRYVCPLDQREANKRVMQAVTARSGWTTGRRHRLGAGLDSVTFIPDFELPARRVFVEVEFGNVSSLHRDFVKFECLASAERLHAAVLVVPARRVARMMDPAVGHSGRAANLVSLLRPTYPLAIVEVDLAGGETPPVKARYEKLVAAYRGRGALVSWADAMAT